MVSTHERERVLLSIIIPTLNSVDTALMLGRRVRNLLSNSIVEVVIVCPAAALPANRAADASFVIDGAEGVYAAYSRGMSIARGEYVWLLGDDDYPLDSIIRVARLLKAGFIDVLIAPVIFSSGRIYHPRKAKISLLFRNWCQQGVIYRRTLLARYRFFRRLKVQADHYVNVLLRSDPSLKLAFTTEPLCVFGIHGLSSRQKDLRFRALRSALAQRTVGPAGRLLVDALGCVGSTINRLRATIHKREYLRRVKSSATTNS